MFEVPDFLLYYIFNFSYINLLRFVETWTYVQYKTKYDLNEET